MSSIKLLGRDHLRLQEDCIVAWPLLKNSESDSSWKRKSCSSCWPLTNSYFSPTGTIVALVMIKKIGSQEYAKKKFT